MKKTYRERRAFLDRLEKKYMKKVQLHAFKRENDLLKSELTAMRGATLDQLHSRDNLVRDNSFYKLNYF